MSSSKFEYGDGLNYLLTHKKYIEFLIKFHKIDISDDSGKFVTMKLFQLLSN